MSNNSLAGTRWVYKMEDDYARQICEIIFMDSRNAILKNYIGNIITGEEGTQNVECTYVYNSPNVTFTNNQGTETGKIFGNILVLRGHEYTKM